MPGEELDIKKLDVEQPPAPRVLLGIRLVALRSKLKLDAKVAAKHAGVSPSQYSRIEAGTRPLPKEKLAALLDYCSVDTTEAEQLFLLEEATKRPAWWEHYGDVLPTYLANIVGLEQAADDQIDVEVALVPGPLQTEAYARAMVTELAPGRGPAVVDRVVGLRMNRQRILREEHRRFHFVIDEAALIRGVGGPDVMREQLLHLIEVSELPTVTVQVIPRSSGAHMGQEGPFRIFTFHANTSRDHDWHFVTFEGPYGCFYESGQEKALEHIDRYSRIAQVAASPEKTRELIRSMAKELR